MKVEEGMPDDGHRRGDVLQLEEKYSGLGVPELRRLRQLEGNVRQKIVDPSLDKHAARRVKSFAAQEMVSGLASNYRISLRQTCEISLLSASAWYY
ncbi:hypothetical protein ACFQRK_22275 [Parapedobacter sp. GCM10030251]|uniref:hypothetical protein n=1 Tax=Parapedobacter sp. GCM10030251 TaxID=3273419 RepID=UPI0036122D3A